MKTRFKILRYDPERDAKPHYKTFALEVSRGMTLLEALRTLKEEEDGSLTFRWSCESSICGSCAVTVNGVNMLACETQVEALKKSRLLWSPWPAH